MHRGLHYGILAMGILPNDFVQSMHRHAVHAGKIHLAAGFCSIGAFVFFVFTSIRGFIALNGAGSSVAPREAYMGTAAAS